MYEIAYTKTYTRGLLEGISIYETASFLDVLEFFDWAWDQNQKWGEGQSDYKIAFTLQFG